MGFEEIGRLELGTPMGWREAGFTWCNIEVAGKTIPVELHYTFGPEVLIGRNAMKYFIITFDGKNEKIKVEKH